MKPNIPAAIADRFPANDVAAILAAPAWTEYELLGLCYGFNPFVERVNVGQFLGYEWYEVADVLFKEYCRGRELDIARAVAFGGLTERTGTLKDAWGNDNPVKLYAPDDAVRCCAHYEQFPFEPSENGPEQKQGGKDIERFNALDRLIVKTQSRISSKTNRSIWKALWEHDDSGIIVSIDDDSLLWSDEDTGNRKSIQYSTFKNRVTNIRKLCPDEARSVSS